MLNFGVEIKDFENIEDEMWGKPEPKLGKTKKAIVSLFQ